jgi:hypothetical protein
MNQVGSAWTGRNYRKTVTMLDRVREAVAGLGCTGVWALAAGPHIVLGRDGAEPFARVTPLGPGAYGLAFRSPPSSEGASGSFEPVLLIDGLADVVEHALVGEGALPLPA